MDKDPDPADPHRFGNLECRISAMRLSVFDRKIWHLLLDAATLFDLMGALPEKSVRRARLLRSLNQAADAFGDGRGGPDPSREFLQSELGREAASSDLRTQAAGHAHIDTAWLWPIREGIRKCVRTFATQIHLIEKYPDYVFGASQAQHYAFIKVRCPDLYEKIRKAVAEKCWEIQGAMWVEADANITGGESLIRQILHGKNFFEAEFGSTIQTLRLPDVFGFPASLPQILRKAGVDFFLTQKTSWSQVNRFPHHTFFWQRIDGTRILTHFPPEDTYNSTLSPKGLIYARDNLEEKDRLDEFATLFGIGDGGGGPTEEHIERGLRMKNLEGCPQVVFGSARDFFERLSARADREPQLLQTWVGELYLELHRGTLTTQARSKRLNRLLELKLREVELLYACTSLDRYPQERLDRIWKNTLLLQFHDIIPGSSSHQVYAESEKAYEELLGELHDLQAEAARFLFEADAECLTLVNSLSYPFCYAVTLPERWTGHEIWDGDGRKLSSQQEGDRTVVIAEVPALASKVLKRGEEIDNGRTASSRSRAPLQFPQTLENEQVRYVFGERGRLCSAYDKELDRELLFFPEAGNALSLFQDDPVDWEAWDIDICYEKFLVEQAQLQRASLVCSGPVRQGIHLEFSLGHSAIMQNVFLHANSKRLDFETEVEWRERRKMLRVSFEVNVHTPTARFDIQYGFIEISTSRNTSWNAAKFEVADHRFVDLSQGDFGVALLNNCKYGHKALRNTLDLNLLRSPLYPDPEADQGRQVFTYSLLHHPESLTDSPVFREAAMLNQRIGVFDGWPNKNFRVPCTIEGKGVAVEVLKKAEKEKCIIVRAYEKRGCPARAKLLLNDDYTVYETGIMEREEKALQVEDGAVRLQFQVFEIRTFKLKKQ